MHYPHKLQCHPHVQKHLVLPLSPPYGIWEKNIRLKLRQMDTLRDRRKDGECDRMSAVIGESFWKKKAGRGETQTETKRHPDVVSQRRKYECIKKEIDTLLVAKSVFLPSWNSFRYSKLGSKQNLQKTEGL